MGFHCFPRQLSTLTFMCQCQSECSLLSVWWDSLTLFPADKSPPLCLLPISPRAFIMQNSSRPTFSLNRPCGYPSIFANTLLPRQQWDKNMVISTTSICLQHRDVVWAQSWKATKTSSHGDFFVILYPQLCYLKAHVVAMFISCGSILSQAYSFWICP